MSVEKFEVIYDGREHKAKVKCPECGHNHTQRFSWLDQGGKCPECSYFFRIGDSIKEVIS
jgi:DNA-directed RNA polymerase subunit RPC12/RpoP